MAGSSGSGDTVLMIGTRKGLWIAESDERRSAWKVRHADEEMSDVHSVAIDTRADSPRLFASNRSWHFGPQLRRSDDLGHTWQTTPGGEIVFPEDTGTSLEAIWSVAPSPSEPGVVWAGTEPSALFRSEDNGETFSMVRALWDHPHRKEWGAGAGGAAVHTVLPHPTDDDRVLVAMSAGGVYLTEDGGQSWRPANRGISAYFFPDPYPEYGQCVHKVARDAGDPDRYYAQNHRGVYRSDDGAASWQSIADGLPADFGFVALASPRTPGTAWFIPLVSDGERIPPDGRLRVHRTRDGGQTWTEFGPGLPDGCWNSVLRDAACVDTAEVTGIYLGTRDGSVYASADEGEHFTLVTEHLPDVLCVRAVVLE